MHLTLYSARLCTLTAILAPLVGIHRRFIAHFHRRGCPAVVPVRCKAISVLRPPGSSCGPPSSLQAGGGENHCYTHPPMYEKWGSYRVQRKTGTLCNGSVRPARAPGGPKTFCRGSPRLPVSARAVVKVPVNGRSPAGDHQEAGE